MLQHLDAVVKKVMNGNDKTKTKDKRRRRNTKGGEEEAYAAVSTRLAHAEHHTQPLSFACPVMHFQARNEEQRCCEQKPKALVFHFVAADCSHVTRHVTRPWCFACLMLGNAGRRSSKQAGLGSMLAHAGSYTRSDGQFWPCFIQRLRQQTRRT